MARRAVYSGHRPYLSPQHAEIISTTFAAACFVVSVYLCDMLFAAPKRLTRRLLQLLSQAALQWPQTRGTSQSSWLCWPPGSRHCRSINNKEAYARIHAENWSHCGREFFKASAKPTSIDLLQQRDQTTIGTETNWKLSEWSPTPTSPKSSQCHEAKGND